MKKYLKKFCLFGMIILTMVIFSDFKKENEKI